MNTARYRIVLFVQLLLLLFDLVINAFSDLFRVDNIYFQLITYVIQDICILMAFLIMFLEFFMTFVFEAGLLDILIKKFRTAIFTTLVYLGISIGLHILTLTERWSDSHSYIWTKWFHVVYAFQRTMAVFYYYLYKRGALKLADDSFYENSDYVKQEFQRRRGSIA